MRLSMWIIAATTMFLSPLSFAETTQQPSPDSAKLPEVQLSTELSWTSGTVNDQPTTYLRITILARGEAVAKATGYGEKMIMPVFDDAGNLLKDTVFSDYMSLTNQQAESDDDTGDVVKIEIDVPNVT